MNQAERAEVPYFRPLLINEEEMSALERLR